jgi:hypothetical protein
MTPESSKTNPKKSGKRTVIEKTSEKKRRSSLKVPKPTQPTISLGKNIPKQIDQETIEKSRQLLKKFINRKYGTLYLDIFLLFALSIAFGIILSFDEIILGLIFIIFAVICCGITSYFYYSDVKRDIDLTLKDLEIILK